MDRNRQIRSHAGLRGIAALLVVAYHLQLGGGYRLAVEEATSLFTRSYLFVDLFFVLSGFILSYINDADRSDMLSFGQYRRFIARRLIRLYPLLFCTLVFMVVERAIYTALLSETGHPLRVDWSGGSLAILASQFLLLNAWYAGPAGWNVPSWSISAEMVAYLLFPLIVHAALRRPAATRLAQAALAIAFYGWVLGDTGSLDIIGGPAPARCLAGFSIGMLLHAGRSGVTNWRSAWLSIVQCGCVAGIVAVLIADIPDPFAMIFFAGLVLTTWTDRGLIARLLGRQLPVYLGEISYSVYLTHVCLLEVLGAVWRARALEAAIGSDMTRIAYILASYTIVLIVSGWTFARIEAPARAWLTRRLLHRTAPPIATSPPGP